MLQCMYYNWGAPVQGGTNAQYGMGHLKPSQQIKKYFVAVFMQPPGTLVEKQRARVIIILQYITVWGGIT